MLRGLLAERVPILNLPAILAHVDAAPETLSVGDLLAQVRLLPAVSANLPGNSARSVMRKLPSEHEQLFRDALLEYGPERVVSMPVEDCQIIINAVQSIMSEDPTPGALVVEDEHIRPFLRRFIAEDYPRLSVLSAREVAAVTAREEVREVQAAVSV